MTKAMTQCILHSHDIDNHDNDYNINQDYYQNVSHGYNDGCHLDHLQELDMIKDNVVDDHYKDDDDVYFDTYGDGHFDIEGP